MPTAEYQIGTAQRPYLPNDRGFADCIRSPTPIDRGILTIWQNALEVAEAGQGVPAVPHNALPDALAAYRHFLYGKGKARKFSYDRYVANDKSGRVALENAIYDFQDGIEEIATQSPYLTNFEVTSSGIRCGSKDPNLSAYFPYPDTENWQKAIGAHWIWMSGIVTATRGTDRSFVATMVLHAEDLYNFNPNAHDIATKVPDAMNGALEESCLGHEYMNVSELTRVVRWRYSAPAATTTNPNAGKRERNPQDNLRLRNRL